MKVTITNITRFTTNKDGEPLKTKDGRPYTPVRMQVVEKGDKHTLSLRSPTYSDGDAEESVDGIWAPIEIFLEARTAYAKKRDKAGEKGKEVHAEIEGLIKWAIKKNDGFINQVVDLKKSNNKQVQQFIGWASGLGENVKFLSSEKVLHSVKMFTAGTADFTCEIDGKKYLGDLKTGNTIQTTAFYQCAGYILMAEEEGEKFDGITVVHVPAKGELKEYRRFDIETDKQAFLGILSAFKADKTHDLSYKSIASKNKKALLDNNGLQFDGDVGVSTD